MISSHSNLKLERAIKTTKNALLGYEYLIVMNSKNGLNY